MSRKLATVRKIDAVLAIPDADKICAYQVGGWFVVDSVGKYEIDDLVIFCEVDSWIPTELAPFLSKGNEPREYNGVKGERLKTIRLRGQLSQGLLLPTSIAEWKIAPGEPFVLEDDSDVTELLGIQKWEAPINAQLAGVARGNFPTLIPKTDQERIQNLKKRFEEWKTQDITWEVTEKLDGSSCTFYMSPEGEFEVCSRNLSLKFSEENSFWKAAIANQIQSKMLDAGLVGFAIQGELIGEGIQGNKYGLKGQQFYVFDMYSVAEGGFYLAPQHRRAIADELKLNHVPVIGEATTLNFFPFIQDVLAAAEEKSRLNPNTEREGLVWKRNDDPDVSFKAISNKWLLKTGE